MVDISALLLLLACAVPVLSSSGTSYRVPSPKRSASSHYQPSKDWAEEALLRQLKGTEPVYAYVAWSKDVEMAVRPGRPSTGSLAWCRYVPSYNETGWATFELHSNATLDDSTQAQAAGFLEGYVTGKYIWDTYQNLNTSHYCDGEQAYCERLQEFFAQNQAWAAKQQASVVAGTSEAAFWHQYQLIFEQLVTLEYGYNAQAIHNGGENTLNFNAFLMLAFYMDVGALESTLKKTKLSKLVGSSSCSAMVKIAGEYDEVLFTHDTWAQYNTMLRIYKYYDLPYTRDGTEASGRVPGSKVSFSSYPGFLHSTDDFYTTNAKLAVMETTIGNNNPKLFAAIVPETAMYFYRVQIANRLARSSAEWSEVFAQHNSGTYNNQWMVFDYKLFTPGRRPLPGAFVVLEQLPTLIVSKDMTDFLIATQHWVSYNSPYFSAIFDLGGFQSMVDRYGNFFSYALCPRARIFRRDHNKVVDVASLKKLMRYNDFEHDPFAHCQCSPPYSGVSGIAARCDLNPANGTYPIPALGHRMHGATDCKITTAGMMEKLQAHAISGPTNDQQPTFKWSTSGVAVRPASQPDAFDHDFTIISWETV